MKTISRLSITVLALAFAAVAASAQQASYFKPAGHLGAGGRAR
jgi:hypothetical protein